MSTPSTATATLPPHHQYYSHHQAYQTSGQLSNGTSRIANPLYNGYSNGTTTSSDLRRTATVNSRQAPLPPATHSEHTESPSNMSSSSRKRDRRPDWNEFYKNGLPEEVIVIDDSPEPQTRTNHATRTAATNGATKHADKKRKTAASTTYDPVYNQQTSYSTTQTPYYDQSPSDKTNSSDRTASALNTTAATSLGSTASNGTHNGYLEDGVVGQKRKRVTRKTIQDEVNEAKRREIDYHGDPLSLYVPPPNPPIKAKEVYVQVIPDVSSLFPHALLVYGG